MKRALGLILAAPLMFAVGCSDDEAAEAANSFTMGYDLGTQVVLEGKEVSSTKRFVELDGKVYEADSVNLTGTDPVNGGLCRVDEANKQMTESHAEVTSVSKVRIAGLQQAWVLPGQYNNFSDGGSPVADGAVNAWGDPAAGTFFFSKPAFDVFVGNQAAGLNNRAIDNYVEVDPVNLYLFEQDVDFDIKITNTTTSIVGSVKTVINQWTEDQTTPDDDGVAPVTNRNRALTTFARFVHDGYVWQTGGNLGGLYTSAGLPYTAGMIIPDVVSVGDTWLDPTGLKLVSAVGFDAVDVGGTVVRALHVVERGSTDVDLTANGVDGWCVTRFSSNDSTAATTGVAPAKSSELTDDCNLGVGVGVNQVGTGWVNQRHTWYYAGLPVKIEETVVDVAITEYGYARGSDGTAPAPNNGSAAAGNCARYTKTTPGVALAADLQVYKPYAHYSVVKTTRTYQATQLRKNYTLAAEAKEEAAAQ